MLEYFNIILDIIKFLGLFILAIVDMALFLSPFYWWDEFIDQRSKKEESMSKFAIASILSEIVFILIFAGFIYMIDCSTPK